MGNQLCLNSVCFLNSVQVVDFFNTITFTINLKERYKIISTHSFFNWDHLS